LKKGKFTSCTAELTGEDMYHFLGKLVELVMPKVKDYKGVSWSSGDQTGNVSFGFDPEAVALFPEIEYNYDAFPEKMLPGIHVSIHTSAKLDKEARLLLTAMGVPFTGKFQS
jgi:large subunit ribosomal protein L5